MLVRSDKRDRKERTSLGLKYVIDTSLLPNQERETAEFASYLAYKYLYIDVWDGDSMMNIGTMQVQLSALLRQGAPNVRVVNEYDVLSVDSGMDHTSAPIEMTTADGVGECFINMNQSSLLLTYLKLIN